MPSLHNSRSKRRTTKRFPCSGFSKTLTSTCGRLSLRPSLILTALLASMWVSLANPTLDNSHNPICIAEQMMNEPHRGYIDLPSLHKFDYKTDLHLSYVRTCSQRHPPPPHSLSIPSICFPVFYACIRLPNFCWILDSLVPSANSSYRV